MAAGYFSTRTDYETMNLSMQLNDAKEAEKQRKQNKELVDAGLVSALDLNAPNSAIEEFNNGVASIKEQKPDEAIKHLQRSLKIYPKFVSAHVNLGLAYLGQEDPAHAQSEFEAAAKLDEKFSRPRVQLGSLALSRKDYATAEVEFARASALSPSNSKILSSLAFAQNQNHHYKQVLETCEKVHALPHKDSAEVHYLAAVAARSLNDFATMEQQLGVFVNEAPTSPFAPVARHDLEVLAHNKQIATLAANTPPGQQYVTLSASLPAQTFPDTDRLKAELSALGDDSDDEGCSDCAPSAEGTAVAANGNSVQMSASTTGWTIHKSVDEVAQFFAVSSHGHMVSDLVRSNIQIRDDNKPPEKILQFTPQSKLPLLLGLLVDTSGSVEDRFSFEKRAAAKFVQKILSSPTDLGFIAGFSTETTVTQDFVADPDLLGKGIDSLKNKGGTSLFDAVSLACWKLAAYPERERVAKVLVVLSDGEDNSSQRTLKQSIRDAEATGVTIYTVSTSENEQGRTAADKVLQALAERSGGEAIFPGDISGLAKSLDDLRDLIRSRYLIAYRPANFEPNGAYRSIQIVAEKNGKRLQVHARKGYYARLEAVHN
ncbi:MAG: VWA domain-containing protein [Terriglobales bacterium]